MNRMKIRRAFLTIITVLFPVLSVAQSNPAVGLWKNEEPTRTIYIRTSEEAGKLVGKVEKIVKNGAEDTTGTCSKCQGDNKDRPVLGMTIIWDMQKEKDTAKWSGGKILEPDTGKIYACRIEPSPDGGKLNVRGSIAFLGKTQTWTRVE